jgi:hypothetical protein
VGVGGKRERSVHCRVDLSGVSRFVVFMRTVNLRFEPIARRRAALPRPSTEEPAVIPRMALRCMCGEANDTSTAMT